jgi:hypothetical protein
MLPEPLARCAVCGMRYNPTLTAAACPHASRIETPLLKSLREAGPPYGIANAEMEDKQTERRK